MSDFSNFLEKTQEVGYIASLSHSVAFVSGLPSLKLEEMVITESGKNGIVHGLRKEWAEILMINTKGLKVGETVVRTEKLFGILVGEGLLGRVINPISQPLDYLGPITGEKEYQPIKRPAPTFRERVRMKKPLETGVMIVDFLVPIAHGQRELIIGDAKTGKTTLLLQAIVSQVRKGAIGIYVGIGKKDMAIKWVEEYLKQQGVFEKTVIIHAPPDDSPTLAYLAPYSGMSIAEYFRDRGKDVIVVLDDLTTHAKIYREISLLLNRAPGRDSYPGEIFHIQAALLERAGNIKQKNGQEVSITALPVAETLENDISGYIQTNLIAITDGHIFFDINEFRKGRRPAINAFLSVSRVGNQTKAPIERELAGLVRKKLLEYYRLLEFTQFGTELSKETQKILKLGERIELLFNQGPEITIPRQLQLLLVGLLISGFWDDKPLTQMKMEISALLENYRSLEFEEKIEKIRDLPHLQFFIQENLPKIEKILS